MTEDEIKKIWERVNRTVEPDPKKVIVLRTPFGITLVRDSQLGTEDET